jgi:hypothetical protein
MSLRNKVRDYGEGSENGDESGRSAGLRRNPGRFGRGGISRGVDGDSESVTGGSAHGNSRRTAGRVVRLAREAAAIDARGTQGQPEPA